MLTTVNIVPPVTITRYYNIFGYILYVVLPFL